MPTRRPSRAPLDRRTKWLVKTFQEGRCIKCGEDRGESPFKRLCCICGKKERKRQEQYAGKTKPTGAGRPSFKCNSGSAEI